MMAFIVIQEAMLKCKGKIKTEVFFMELVGYGKNGNRLRTWESLGYIPIF